MTEKQMKPGTMPWYDYEHQAWVEDGVYQRCGHPDTMACGCYGREHAGQRPSIEMNWQTVPLDMSLEDAMSAHLMTDTLVRTQDGVIWRKKYRRASFERLTRRDGTPLARAARWLR